LYSKRQFLKSAGKQIVYVVGKGNKVKSELLKPMELQD
jgi:hypothetical protein